MESKTFTREEAKDAIECVIKSIAITIAVCEVEFPNSRDILLEEMIGELEKMRSNPREPEQGDTCKEGPGVCDCRCAAAPRKGMTFGNALDALKAGFSVAREGWNGKHQYVELATCISYKGNAGEIVNVHHNNIGNKALAFIGTSGVQMGWLASQADMLAEDWYIVE